MTAVRQRLILLACSGLLLGAPGSALAQGGGVTVDAPGSSPADKEYALPLEQARREATGQDTSVTPSDSSPASSGVQAAPLFGEGVVASAHEGDRAASTAGAASGRVARQQQSSASSGSPSSVNSVLTGTRAVTAVSPGGSSSFLTIGGVSLAVLLLGGVLGSIARRRGSDL
jgi:cobalamin biosynthesis Mg chelatase CobN